MRLTQTFWSECLVITQLVHLIQISLVINLVEVATGATNSNFFGQQAGYQATSAFASTFIGQNAGYGATNANNSTFIGQNAGSNATGASSINVNWF
jgi:hypothetical protein